MYHTPLTWYEKENMGKMLMLKPCPEHCGFASLYIVSWITKTLRVGPTGWYTGLQNP